MTKCPITRQEFAGHAKPVEVMLGDVSLTAGPKEFSTHSLGWNLNDKREMVVNGKRCMCQVGLNVTIIGSKELPQ